MTTKLRLLSDLNSVSLWRGKTQILGKQVEKCARLVHRNPGSVGHVSEPRRMSVQCPPATAKCSRSFKQIVVTLGGCFNCTLDSTGGVYLLYFGPKAGVKVATLKSCSFALGFRWNFVLVWCFPSDDVTRKCKAESLKAKSLSVSSGRSSRALHKPSVLLQRLPERSFLRRNLWFIHYILSLSGQ